MGIDHSKALEIADGCTSAWNAGSSGAVAEFYAQDGKSGILIQNLK